MVLSESFEGRTFVTTRKGELLRFALTAPTYKRLFAVYELLAKGLFEAPVQPQSDQTSHES